MRLLRTFARSDEHFLTRLTQSLLGSGSNDCSTVFRSSSQALRDLTGTSGAIVNGSHEFQRAERGHEPATSLAQPRDRSFAPLSDSRRTFAAQGSRLKAACTGLQHAVAFSSLTSLAAGSAAPLNPFGHSVRGLSTAGPRAEEQERHSPEADDDALRRVEMPLIHPKASVTSEFHPCGAELLEFPFSAKAFYVGRDYKKRMKQLREKADLDGWQVDQAAGQTVICLREKQQPFDEQEDYTGLPCETYIIPLDRMEAVVFFNGFGQERELWEQHTGGALTSRFIEETRVTVIPDLDKHSKLFSDRVVLQQAELSYLQTIAYVLGQTVSLHYYELQVDHMLRTFKDMNKEMQRTGTFKPIATKEELLQMVARNNLLFTDIISKLGIMERFDIAWKNANCSDVYEHLRADMEIENRNSNLQVKLDLVSENVKYLLELMQNQKSDFLEWIIIILIGAEIMVSLFDMMHKLN